MLMWNVIFPHVKPLAACVCSGHLLSVISRNDHDIWHSDSDLGSQQAQMPVPQDSACYLP